MNYLIKILTNHPWQTSLGAIAIYFLVFAFAGLGNSESFGHGEGKSNVASLVNQLPMETGLVVSVLAMIGILGLWRESGFRHARQGGLKFVLAPAIFTMLLLLLALNTPEQEGKSVVQIIGLQNLLFLVLVALLVGLYEECLFRGLAFHGACTQYNPIPAVLITSILFGAMHFVNFVGGQPLAETLLQMLHAAIAGFMYAMLRLRIGAIWPLILLHGFWDATVVIIGSSFQTQPEAASLTGDYQVGLGTFLVMSPELIYGLFLLWCWRKWKVSYFDEDTGDQPNTHR